VVVLGSAKQAKETEMLMRGRLGESREGVQKIRAKTQRSIHGTNEKGRQNLLRAQEGNHTSQTPGMAEKRKLFSLWSCIGKDMH